MVKHLQWEPGGRVGIGSLQKQGFVVGLWKAVAGRESRSSVAAVVLDSAGEAPTPWPGLAALLWDPPPEFWPCSWDVFQFWVDIVSLHLCSLHYCISCALFLRNAALHRHRNKSCSRWLCRGSALGSWC